MLTSPQVAVDRTRPNGRVIGIDLLPAQPPRGVATFQGNFLSPAVRKLVKDFIVDARNSKPCLSLAPRSLEDGEVSLSETMPTGIDRPSYIDQEHSSAPRAEDDLGPYIVDVGLFSPTRRRSKRLRGREWTLADILLPAACFE